MAAATCSVKQWCHINSTVERKVVMLTFWQAMTAMSDCKLYYLNTTKRAIRVTQTQSLSDSISVVERGVGGGIVVSPLISSLGNVAFRRKY
jgi:hypothetical protein